MEIFEIEEIPVEAIDLGVRLREDGNSVASKSLVASIRKWGLLHPIVVRKLKGDDERFELVAGARRLDAHRKLGESTISATVISATDDEKVAIEFAENDERQDFSSYERAGVRREWALGEYHAKREAEREAKRKAAEEVAQARERAAEAAAESEAEADEPGEGSAESQGSEVSARAEPKPPKNLGGRPTEAASDAEVAQASGQSRAQVQRDRQQLQAGERYPMLATRIWAQEPAIKVARSLDQIPEAARSTAVKIVEDIVKGDARWVGEAMVAVENFAKAPPEKQATFVQFYASSDENDQALVIRTLRGMEPHRASEGAGALEGQLAIMRATVRETKNERVREIWKTEVQPALKRMIAILNEEYWGKLAAVNGGEHAASA
jgi:ParB/RepB/Spo0J family partition protein